MSRETRTGLGFDVHRFAGGRPLILGGVRVPHDEGLEGHSDADVLLHAVADALLGTVALGDIGQHFPNTDPAWHNADSRELLRRVVALVAAAGVVRVVHVDATVIAERPRLAPYAAAMREAMAGVLGIAADRVSLKATTAETMGALGRREGMAAMAVVTVEVEADA